MNVAFGGTLHQHLPDMPGMLEHGVPVADTISTHRVKPAPWQPAPGHRRRRRARRARRTIIRGSTGSGDGLVATGWSDDGLVEALERVADDPYEDGWMLGVQWHPEDTAANDPAQQAIFDGFALMAKWRGSRAKPGETHGRSREYGLVDYDDGWPGDVRTRGGADPGRARRPRRSHRPRGFDVRAGTRRETGDRYPALGGVPDPAGADRRSAASPPGIGTASIRSRPSTSS